MTECQIHLCKRMLRKHELFLRSSVIALPMNIGGPCYMHWNTSICSGSPLTRWSLAEGPQLPESGSVWARAICSHP